MKFFNVVDFGAIPNDKSLQTVAIQTTIDVAVSANGAVVIPSGVFVTGTLNLKSVSLCLEKGAVLKGSSRIEDYRWNGYSHNEMGNCTSLLYSLNGSDLHIYGEGTIDLSGSDFYFFELPIVPETLVPMNREQLLECSVKHDVRPNQPMFFHNMKNVKIENITILDAPCWTMSFVECENIRASNLTIRGNQRIPNNDGMHFCGCRKVFVTGCDIETADDCIALSGITDWNRPCEDVTISDCMLKSYSKALSIGYMHSIVRNVTVINCVITESNRAISIMSSSGSGIVENIIFSNIVIDTRIRAGNWWGNGEPILIMATYHHFYQAEIPRSGVRFNVKNIQFNNIICHSENAIGLIGVNDNISDITFRDITINLVESKNIELKGKVFDLEPSKKCETIPEDGESYIFVSRNVTNLYLEHVCGVTEKGHVGKIFINK